MYSIEDSKKILVNFSFKSPTFPPPPLPPTLGNDIALALTERNNENIDAKKMCNILFFITLRQLLLMILFINMII